MRTIGARTSLGVGMVGVAAVFGGVLSQAKDRPVYNRASAVYPAGNAAHGRQLATDCLVCHRAEAPSVGDPAYHAPKLRYQRVSTLFYALQDYRAGNRHSVIMEPIAKGLSDQDMRDLASTLSARTLKSRIVLGKDPIPDTPAHQFNSRTCGMCHGETGLGEADGYPVLAGQHQDYIEHALNAYRSGERTNPIMQRFARSLSPDQVKRMAEYFATKKALEPAQ